ncbi:hypothetical protein DFH07DRAFT_767858 [Mycena maculata]|uniref:Uncharacterized protein n=1 Tax=Mycena maculata TaxID=230809 RepID=A0AAD7NRU4_9AGAR|nr:hypothetical protein DFH07DRAFT_767858 [Mycena maculata]
MTAASKQYEQYHEKKKARITRDSHPYTHLSQMVDGTVRICTQPSWHILVPPPTWILESYMLSRNPDHDLLARERLVSFYLADQPGMRMCLGHSAEYSDVAPNAGGAQEGLQSDCSVGDTVHKETGARWGEPSVGGSPHHTDRDKFSAKRGKHWGHHGAGDCSEWEQGPGVIILQHFSKEGRCADLKIILVGPGNQVGESKVGFRCYSLVEEGDMVRMGGARWPSELFPKGVRG